VWARATTLGSMGSLIFAIISVGVLVAAVRGFRRWSEPLPQGPDDLRRADDGVRSDRDGPIIQAWRSMDIPINKWPPDDPSQRR
jgi:hypothetical protein